MIILRHGKFISGGRLYKAGEVLPDTSETRELVAKGLAEAIENIKKTKATKKSEPDKAENTQENAEGNT